MTKKRFFDILNEEGFSQESIDEIYASPLRPNIHLLHEVCVRAAAKYTKIHIALEAIQNGTISIISLN